jgi:tRNA-dihydrouridine synthase B
MLTESRAIVLRTIKYNDEYRGILHVRRHLAATPLFKGLPNFRQTRINMLRAEHVDELFDIMESTRPLIRAAEASREHSAEV